MPNLNNNAISRNIFIFLIMLITSFTTYANSLNNKFVFDDRYLVVKNTFIKHIETLPNIFKYNTFYFAPYDDTNYYRPIALLSYALDYGIWKLNPFGYHFTNVLFHSISSFLFFYLILMLFNNFNLALLCGILFAIHPLNSSGINFIACRDNLLATSFGLAGIIYYLMFSKSHKTLHYVLSLMFFSLGLLSKESALLFVPLIAICAIKNKERMIDTFKKLVPFMIVSLFYVSLRYYILRILLTVTSGGYSLNIPLEILNFFNIVFNYLKLLILPFNLHVMRTTNFITSLFTLKSILIVILSIFLFLLFIWSIKNKKDLIWFGIAWFIISISFVIKTMYVKPYLGASMSEWWLYLSSMGFFLILGDLLLSLFHKFKTVSIILIMGICIFWISSTVYNNMIWQDELQLYHHNLKISPLNNDIRINLANAYLELKNYEMAGKGFHRALDLEPDSWEAYLGMGNILYARNKLEEALEMYKRCLKLKPNLSEAWNNVGLIYEKKGDNDSALHSFLAAVKHNPYLDYAYANLARFHLNIQDYKKALVYCNKAIELNPDNDTYFTDLGVIYASQNLIKEALFAFDRALAINPRAINAMLNLGNLYANIGQLDTAIRIWEEALILEPDNENIKNNIKIARGLRKQ